MNTRGVMVLRCALRLRVGLVIERMVTFEQFHGVYSAGLADQDELDWAELWFFSNNGPLEVVAPAIEVPVRLTAGGSS